MTRLTLKNWILYFSFMVLCWATGIAAGQNSTATPATYQESIRPENAGTDRQVRLPDSADNSGDMAEEPLPLPGPQAAEPSDRLAPKAGNPVIKTFGSLVLVIGVFAAIAFWMRRVGGRGGQSLPKEVWEVLGRGPLDTKHYVQLVKFGDRLLLVGISNNGIRTLTEVTDPEEVRQLSSASRRNGSSLAGRWPSGLAAKVTGRRVKSTETSVAPGLGDPRIEKELDPAYLGSGHA